MEMARTRRERVALAMVFTLLLVMVSAGAKCEKQPKRTQTEIEVDNQMNTKVRENLTANPDIRATDIGVNTFMLIVKLDGKVRSEGERNLAIQIARDSEIVKDGTTHKVKEVITKDLTVKPQ